MLLDCVRISKSVQNHTHVDFALILFSPGKCYQTHVDFGANFEIIY